MAARGDHGFQGGGRVGGPVKGSVEGDGHPGGGLDERSGAFDVDRGIGLKESEDYPVRPRRLGDGDFAQHDTELGVRVEEVAAPWANHDVELEAREGSGGLKGP